MELVELIENEPISIFEIERKTMRKYSTIKCQLEFLELLDLIKIEKVQKGKLYHYEIKITYLGNRIKEKINFNLHKTLPLV